MYNYICNPNFCNSCCGRCIYVLGNGSAGKDGKAATIEVGTVTSGDTPSVINSGTENAAVFDFVLVPGQKGETGDTGSSGSDGKAATIKIGTVTSGSTPMVTNSGTENDAILDFVLVPGQKGDKGDTGAAGSGLSAYSGGYNSVNQSVTFASANTPIQVKLDKPFPEANLSKSGNTFKIQQTGIYEIIYNIDISTNKSVGVTTSVRQNNISIVPSINLQQLNTNQKSDGLFSAAFICNLNANDIIDLSISVDSIPSGLTLTIFNNSNCEISIKKIA